MDLPSATPNPPAKTPVVRGARACTVCRQAKMKCVGAEDGKSRCQRCQRADVECIFEKHRRGRKPGSKLSEASKMLRRLEKGLNNAKAKQPASSPLSQSSPSTAQFPQDDAAGPSSFAGSSTHAAQQYDDDMDEDEDDRPEDALYPEKVIRSSTKASFLDIVMNPEPPATDHPRPNSGSSSDRAPSLPKAASQSPSRSHSSPQPRAYISLYGRVPKDPVEAGIIPEHEVSSYFDMFFLRLNPFVNLFDPSLHSADYVRQRSRFLFTTMLMACCKFFRGNLYHDVRHLAEQWCVYTFAEGTESVETVQALACMTYWEEPTDRRTWSYIGMACRMAVNLNLNKYVGRRQEHESPLAFLKRRNQERTYLVLFVHDRSLSMQTGKHWQLHEDDLVRNASTWHEDGCSGPRGEVRPEDVIVAAFVRLRLIGSEATDSIYPLANAPSSPYGGGSTIESELVKCNQKLDEWLTIWVDQLQRCTQADGFHTAFIRFFQSHVRLFLNTFGLRLAHNEVRPVSNAEAVAQCYQSACTNLQIISDFDKLHVLQYCQESITVMTAYAAVVLLTILRNPKTTSQVRDGAADEIYLIIGNAADAYQHAGHSGSEVDSAGYHARFLRRLLTVDTHRARQQLDRNGYRQDGAFSQGLPPLRTGPALNGLHIPQVDQLSLPRPGHSHAHQPSTLPPLNMSGPSHHMSSFPTQNAGAIDASFRSGHPHNQRMAAAYPLAPSPSNSDESYWDYMWSEVDPLCPKAGSASFGGGLMGVPAAALNDFAYPAPHSFRGPQYPPHHLGGDHQGRSAATHYLPPMQPPYGHPGYDGPR
ncbi:fungal-specific transcription factor domain-containing protein [Trametes meyenii]|nr:fungal-specific transcription factor domain-containing protein [Trametes meyenii]